MIEKILLPNGVRIVYERMPNVRSVSCGVWVGAGSRYEKASENGASHFIEHMVFKGTETRSAGQLAEIMDAVGGQVNAFTAKDCTCFYGRVLDEQLPVLTDVLCDMLFNSAFAPECVESERGVICDEIDMYEDTPDDLVSERLAFAVFKGTPLSRPVLGTKRTLSKMTGETLRRFMKTHYRADNTVIALAGSFTDEDLRSLSDRFSEIPSAPAPDFPGASYAPAVTVRRKPTEQNHICIAFPGVPLGSEDRFAARILDEALGGGMSSRLFQSLREERGLCYSVCTYSSAYSDCGILSLYAAVSREAEAETVAAMLNEVKRLTDSGITEDELSRVCGQARANLLMELESTGGRMMRLGRGELLCGGAESTDSLISGFRSVKCTDVLELARKTMTPENISLSAVGRIKPADEYRRLICESF